MYVLQSMGHIFLVISSMESIKLNILSLLFDSQLKINKSIVYYGNSDYIILLQKQISTKKLSCKFIPLTNVQTDHNTSK